MAGKLPTKIAEDVYSVLQRFADADPDYYMREAFIFHFGVLKDKSNRFELTCMDGAKRTFYCNEDGEMKLLGKGANRVNQILEKITKEFRNEITLGEFTITRGNS